MGPPFTLNPRRTVAFPTGLQQTEPQCSLAQLCRSPGAAGRHCPRSAHGAVPPPERGAATGSGLGAASGAAGSLRGQRGCPRRQPSRARPGQQRGQRCPAGALLPRGRAGTASPRGPAERPIASAPSLRRAPAGRARSRTSPGARALPAPGPAPVFPRRPGPPSAPRSRRTARAGGRLGRRVSALRGGGAGWELRGRANPRSAPQASSAARSSLPSPRRGTETSCPPSSTETSR